MTDTIHLGLPLIEAGQAQKHVTHNEALRLLDAAIQIAVEDRTRTLPPASPAEGARHIVAADAAGAWAGHGGAIANYASGAWDFLAPRAGWCVWSVADDAMCVYDGTQWRDLRSLALDNLSRLGINTTAASPNLLAVKSNAALLAAIDGAGGGSGDMRLQLTKESAAHTASVVFANNYSGRAEFGLVGADAFKLKVSADGAGWTEAFAIDPGSGNLALGRGLALCGVAAPAPITANLNDYNPAGLASASVLQIWSDAARSLSGLAGGAEGRLITLINVGSQPITLLDDSIASAAANRFTLGGGLILAGKQAALLRYDGTAARWQAIAGGLMLRTDVAQALPAARKNQAMVNLATTTNDNASAGGIGEYLESSTTSPGIALVSNIYTTITFIDLTPGDWDVTGWLEFDTGGGTSFTILVGSISTMPNAYGGDGTSFFEQFPANIAAALIRLLPVVRASVATTTRYYLIGRTTHTGANPTAFGRIRARRMR